MPGASTVAFKAITVEEAQARYREMMKALEMTNDK